MKYEVRFKKIIIEAIEANNNYDLEVLAEKMAERLGMEIDDYWVQDGQMKPDIHPAFDDSLHLIENINKL